MSNLYNLIKLLNKCFILIGKRGVLIFDNYIPLLLVLSIKCNGLSTKRPAWECTSAQHHAKSLVCVCDAQQQVRRAPMSEMKGSLGCSELTFLTFTLGSSVFPGMNHSRRGQRRERFFNLFRGFPQLTIDEEIGKRQNV